MTFPYISEQRDDVLTFGESWTYLLCAVCVTCYQRTKVWESVDVFQKSVLQLQGIVENKKVNSYLLKYRMVKIVVHMCEYDRWYIRVNCER